jgi:hypothetical protein
LAYNSITRLYVAVSPDGKRLAYNSITRLYVVDPP